MDLTNLLNEQAPVAEPTPQYSKEEYAAKKKAEREALWEQVDTLADGVFESGESLRGFLDFTAGCNHQRTANLLLLYGQNPAITQARTFDGWKRAGRSIRTGEEGYTAIVGQEYEREDGRRAAGYNIGKMFDISQTRGRPVPEPERYEPEELVAAVVQNSPVGIQISGKLPEKIQAQYVPAQRTIFVRNGMDAATTFCSIAREQAHASFAKDGGYRRGAFAAQSYCATYVLAKKYGLDVSGFSFDRVVDACAGLEPQEKRQFLSDVKVAAYTVSRQMEQNLRESQKELSGGEYDIAIPASAEPAGKTKGKAAKAPERA